MSDDIDENDELIDDASDNLPQRKERRGGWRPNGGRPVGSKSATPGLTRREKEAVRAQSKMGVALERVDAAFGQMGISTEGSRFANFGPLETMAFAMQTYLLASERANDLDSQMRWLGAASSVAKDLAPYQSPKLTSIDVNAKVSRSVNDLSDDELIAIATGKGTG